MMWGYGQGTGWWLWGILLLLGIALLVLLAVWVIGGGIRDRQGQDIRGQDPARKGQDAAPASAARGILDERFARGELTAEQYREQLKVLGEGR